MKYFRLGLLTVLSLFLIACNNNKSDINTIYYNLDISTTFKENITVNLDKDAYKKAKENQDQEQSSTNLEYEMLYENIEPINSVHNIYYNKNISKSFNNIKVNLDYKYIEDDFIYSNYIMNCFEEYEINSNEGSLEIYLSGEFYCLNDKDKVNIKVSSIFDVEESNGMLDKDSYVWNIDSTNKDNVDISHVLLRNYDGMIHDRDNLSTTNNNKSNNGLKIFRGFILVLTIGFIIVLKKKNQNEFY